MPQIWICQRETCIGSTINITKFQNSSPLFLHRFLVDEIELEQLYEDFKNHDSIYQEYDFPNYIEHNQLNSKHQKREKLKFKDGMAGQITHSIIALKSKLYLISIGDKQKLCKRNHQIAQNSLKDSVFFQTVAKDA